ncbi:MAG: DUF1223 domain-containing protein [Acidobacteriaceae bacterium]
MMGRRGKAVARTVGVLLACAGAALFAADTPHAGPTPILLELFTSEGCSSCPPVDVWAERLDHFQPVQGAQIIVLSEHVNYWDHDGWKDPFSSDQLTARQREYEQMMGTDGMYTPQVILNGAEVVNVANSAQVIKQTFEKAATLATVPVHLSGVTLAAGDPTSLSGKVTVDATGEKHSGDVFVAVALNQTQTDVLAGENDGKKLTNIAVVRDLVKVGKLEKGKSFEDPFTIKLWPGADPANLRVVAFVQQGDMGHVLGAAMTQAIGKDGESAVATR